MFGLSTLQISLFFALVLGLLGAGFYVYHKDTQSKMAELVAANARLQVSVSLQGETIKKLNATAERNEKLSNELTTRLNDAESYKNELVKILQKHDLSVLSEAKPGLVEKIINDATKKTFDDIARDTDPSSR